MEIAKTKQELYNQTMKKIIFLLPVFLIMACVSYQTATQASKEVTEDPTETITKETKRMNAVIETSQGTITIELFPDKAPKTVANFVELAEGTKDFYDIKTGKKVKRKFYDGLVFHRVIPEFMIQGGCPLGTGTGGPGYKFEDEIDSSLKFDKPGKLAMANSGPNTNGSQFFITEVSTPWLNGNHTIFGQVISGMDIVQKIARTGVDFSDKPVEPVVIKSITIER